MMMTTTTVDDVPLTLGVHATGSVLEDETAHFMLSPLPALMPDEKLEVIVTSFSADADLYVGTTPGAGPENHVWNSTLSTTDTVILGIADVHDLLALYIGVHGYTNASFTVLAFASNSHINLTDGMPQIAYGLFSRYTYFSFSLQGAQDFTITVTPLSGDPDLYVSTSIPFPSMDAGQYTWVSKNFGFDMIDILTTDPDFVADATYYIAVHSFAETMFAITVSTWNSTTIIVERVPISEDVLSGSYVYFKFLLSVSQDVLFTLTPLSSGDPDMFISRIDERPTQQQHTWASLESGVDSILVPVSDPHYGLGWYYIGISGWQGCDFQLLASTEGASIVLVDGVPQNFIQPTGTFSYFRFTHGDSEAGLDFVISNVKQGCSVNCFMSRSVSHPSAEPGKHDMSLLNVSNSGAIELDPPVNVGTYYLGVEALSGVGGLTNFTLHVSTEVGVQILQEDILSDYNTVPAGHYRYFVLDFIRPPGTLKLDDLTFSLKCYENEGDADLFVGTDPTRLPSKEYYVWKSTRAGSDSVTITSTDPNYILGRYYVAVHGFDRSGFALIAFRSTQTVDAIEGVRYSGTVFENHYVYYRFLMTATGSLTVSIKSTLSTGDPDLYISTINVKPNMHDYQWQSIHIGDGSVTIEQATWGWYYIGVHGANNFSAFELHMSHDYLNLLQGYAIPDYVDADSYKRYRMKIASGVSSTALSITLISGITELYVISTMDENDQNYPNRTTYDLSSTSYPGNTILAVEGDPYFVQESTWLISVYAPNETDYFIGAISDHGSLRPGIPMLGISGRNHPTHYIYWVGALGDVPQSGEQGLHIAMQVLEGEVALLVGTDGFPTLESFNWTAEGSDMVYLHIDKDEINTLNLFISVFTHNPQATYTINVAGDDDPTYLLHGQPVEEFTAAESYSFFSVYSSRQSRNMTIEVESCNHKNAPSFYVSNVDENPNEHTGNSSRASGSFRSLYETVVAPFTWQYVGVKGENSSYSIKAVSRDDDFSPRPPNEGVLQGKWAGEGSNATITFSGPITSSKSLLFQIYMLQVPEGVEAADLNMATVCSIEAVGELLTTMNGTSGSEQSYSIGIASKLDHIVNVVVVSDMGLRAAYKPLVLHDSKNDPPGGSPWILWAIIVIVLLAFLGVAVIGLVIVLVVFAILEAKRKSAAAASDAQYARLELPNQSTVPAGLRESLVEQPELEGDLDTVAFNTSSEQ